MTRNRLHWMAAGALALGVTFAPRLLPAQEPDKSPNEGKVVEIETVGPEVGKPAPDFTLKDQSGKSHHLADYKGKTVVLAFYPKDDTPGCTAQMCALRDALPQFKDKGIVVFGVSV